MTSLENMVRFFFDTLDAHTCKVGIHKLQVMLIQTIVKIFTIAVCYLCSVSAQHLNIAQMHCAGISRFKVFVGNTKR